MADSRITLSFDEQDRALLKSLTEEIKSLRAQLAGSALPCPHLVDVLERVGPTGAPVWARRCLLLAGQAAGQGCGR